MVYRVRRARRRFEQLVGYRACGKRRTTGKMETAQRRDLDNDPTEIQKTDNRENMFITFRQTLIDRVACGSISLLGHAQP